MLFLFGLRYACDLLKFYTFYMFNLNQVSATAFAACPCDKYQNLKRIKSSKQIFVYANSQSLLYSKKPLISRVSGHFARMLWWEEFSQELCMAILIISQFDLSDT